MCATVLEVEEKAATDGRDTSPVPQTVFPKQLSKKIGEHMLFDFYHRTHDRTQQTTLLAVFG